MAPRGPGPRFGCHLTAAGDQVDLRIPEDVQQSPAPGTTQYETGPEPDAPPRAQLRQFGRVGEISLSSPNGAAAEPVTTKCPSDDCSGARGAGPRERDVYLHPGQRSPMVPAPGPGDVPQAGVLGSAPLPRRPGRRRIAPSGRWRPPGGLSGMEHAHRHCRDPFSGQRPGPASCCVARPPPMTAVRSSRAAHLTSPPVAATLLTDRGQTPRDSQSSGLGWESAPFFRSTTTPRTS